MLAGIVLVMTCMDREIEVLTTVVCCTEVRVAVAVAVEAGLMDKDVDTIVTGIVVVYSTVVVLAGLVDIVVIVSVLAGWVVVNVVL